MSLNFPYVSRGTASINTGSTTVTGSSSTFVSDGVKQGDVYIQAGVSIPISADAASETSLTLSATWPTYAGNQSGATYFIMHAVDADRVMSAARDFIALYNTNNNLSQLSGLSLVADKLPYANGTGTLALTAFTAWGRSLLGLTMAADKIVYGTDANTMATADFGSAARDFAAVGALRGYQADNIGLAASVAASALTVALKQADASTDPTSIKPVTIAMRSATASSGAINQRKVTGALSLVVPSTATLGMSSATATNLYVYLIDNSGTLELAISAKDFGVAGIQTTTTMSTGATSATTMYSTTGRASAPFRKIGTMVATEATAGTWATAPSSITMPPNGDAESEDFKSLKAGTSIYRAGGTDVAIADGGTGASTAAAARTALFGVSTTVDNTLPRYDGTTGQIQTSGIVVDDSNNVSSMGTLGVGAVTTSGLLTTTNGQIAFPATANPSAGANTFDDSEEGTWTPSVGGSATYTTQTGTYTKLAQLVRGGLQLVINAIGSGSAIAISGQPFTAINVTFNSLSVGYWGALASSCVWLSGIVGASTLALRYATAAAAGLSATSVLASSSEVRGSFQYEAT